MILSPSRPVAAPAVTQPATKETAASA
jgi:hypothetical protein